MGRALGRATVAVALFFAAGSAQAGNLLVAGAPPCDRRTETGYRVAVTGQASSVVNNSGTTLGNLAKYVSETSDRGWRALRWDSSGSPGVELGNLGSPSNEWVRVWGHAINDTGTAVGYAYKYDDRYWSHYAVRWAADGTTATALGHLGVNRYGMSDSEAIDINASGVIAGESYKYVNTVSKGRRAVRWEPGSLDAIELGVLGLSSSGTTTTSSFDINDAGTIVGFAQRYVDHVDKGVVAVRWDAGGIEATELAHLGTNASDQSRAYAMAISETGIAVGYSTRYENGVDHGERAVRWDAGGTAASELENLGIDSDGKAHARAAAVNAAGTAVGYARAYNNPNYEYGEYAVRWDAGASTITVLGIGHAVDINDAGIAVGSSDGGATMWLPDGSLINLNHLGLTPLGGGGTWALQSVHDISSDGWVSGEGWFDPTGTARQYVSLWSAQVGIGGRWTNANGGVWGRGPNWSTGTPAMQVGDATFDRNATYTVSLDRDEVTKRVDVTAGQLSLATNGHTLTTEFGVFVSEGATLTSEGTIISNVTNAGTLGPGNSPGTLTIDGYLVNTGNLEFEIASQAVHDHIDLTGKFEAGGTITIVLLNASGMAVGDTIDLIDWGRFFVDKGYTFNFDQAGLGYQWDTLSFSSNGTIRLVAVPEPGTLALLVGGAAVTGLVGWRRRKRSSPAIIA